jgi:hypothetical protein
MLTVSSDVLAKVYCGIAVNSIVSSSAGTSDAIFDEFKVYPLPWSDLRVRGSVAVRALMSVYFMILSKLATVWNESA